MRVCGRCGDTPDESYSVVRAQGLILSSQSRQSPSFVLFHGSLDPPRTKRARRTGGHFGALFGRGSCRHPAKLFDPQGVMRSREHRSWSIDHLAPRHILQYADLLPSSVAPATLLLDPLAAGVIMCWILGSSWICRQLQL